MSRDQNIEFPVYYLHLNIDQAARNSVESSKQFHNKTEFDVNFSKLLNSTTVADLHHQLSQCIVEAMAKEDDFIIICTPDHIFTNEYKNDILVEYIVKANKLGCDVLLGGMDQFNHAVPLSNNLFWIDSFGSSNFFIVFRNVFSKILNEKPNGYSDLFNLISDISSRKMVVYPFISETIIRPVKDKFQQVGTQLAVYQCVYRTYINCEVPIN